ncbi:MULTISPECIES: helix-turn-helix transcriptional regulator [Snodgrassella]|uniref:helix-turn-helix transcriptional regulator n=1 Tax=Snodgrassella TaxID=1193515 RepID=UPI00226A22C8|nr:helix-turn-helix transcriptional regulator [Snodgrassella sp. B3088]MCX8749230.1 helix-turn-helix transcriptional regulator [Snodgrassella sp. B3088]
MATITLREARERKKLTQLELANAIGCSQVHISGIETGRTSPSKELAKKIAVQLDINVMDLLYPDPE